MRVLVLLGLLLSGCASGQWTVKKDEMLSWDRKITHVYLCEPKPGPCYEVHRYDRKASD